MGIDVAGLEATQRQLKAANRAKLTKAMGDALHQQVPGSTAGAAKGRAGSAGRTASRAAAGTRVRNLPDGVEMSAGGTEFLLGAEFGGRRAPRRRYVTRSPKGTAYVVRRRTTMQFHPWLGHHGYWFTPAWKASLQGVRTKLTTALAKAVDHG